MRGRERSPGRSEGADPTLRDRIIDTARQDYLDALPIAAAILFEDEDGDARIDRANQLFRDAAGWTGALSGVEAAQVPLLGQGTIAKALPTFLGGQAKARELEGKAGKRHFKVRLARLAATPCSARRCLVSLIDRTAQVEAEKSLRSEMLRDRLTGLPNRAAFNEQVDAVLGGPAFREGANAVLVVDLMRFSQINESMGASAGNELLIAFARRLASALRPGDMLARTGGDQFGILLRLRRGEQDALLAADRIKAVLERPFRLSEMEIKADCAVGCAIVTGGLDMADEVLRNAHAALKRAKSDGRTRIYKANHGEAVRRRFSIETELRRAIEADRLRLAFQPLIDMSSGRLSGFEALARWTGEDGIAISPSEFIPVAEESGLIVDLGRWAIEAAVRTLRDWDAKAGRPLPIHVAVNLSAVQIARDDVAAAVASALSANGIEGGRLIMELTESAIIHDPARAGKVLDQLKRLGARVAMDDFGTGYTSLAYLQRLPIDILKIDRSFVAGMLRDKDSIAIVRAILSLANALGMETTAEGVESEELARMLAALGCTYGQGHLFAEPLGADAAFAYMERRSA